MVLMGSLIYAESIFLTSFVRETFLFVFLLFDVLRSLGMSFVYPVLMSYAVELFPECGGFASGMMTGCFGLGAMIWAPLTTYIYHATGDISRVFFTLGILFAAVMLPLTFLLMDPSGAALPQADGEQDSRTGSRAESPVASPAAAQAGAQAAAPVVSLYDVNRKQMLGLPLFYIVFVGLPLASLVGPLAGTSILERTASYLAEFGNGRR
jgi:MFS family permease